MSPAAHDLNVPRVHRRAVDVAVALALVVVAATGTFGSAEFFGPSLLGRDRTLPPLWLGLPLGVLLAVASLGRRRMPLSFLGAALVANAVVAAQPAVMFAIYTFATRASSRMRVGIASAGAAIAVGTPIWRYAGLDGAVPLTTVICVAPALLGLYVATRRELIDRIRERAERAERDQQRRVAQARSEERTQIARDMHDVVTHRVSLMVMQTTALEAAHGSDAAAIGTQIGDTGREALAELRSLVDVLRNDDDAPTRPRQTLADLEDLVEETRGLGIPTILEVVDDIGVQLPVLVEHTLYRVVQEALTNVHKHAAGARTRIRVEHRANGILLTISNSRGVAASDAAGFPVGGHGLLGLTERVRLLGGELTAGGTPEGGFDLRAWVPLARQDTR